MIDVTALAPFRVPGIEHRIWSARTALGKPIPQGNVAGDWPMRNRRVIRFAVEQHDGELGYPYIGVSRVPQRRAKDSEIRIFARALGLVLERETNLNAGASAWFRTFRLGT